MRYVYIFLGFFVAGFILGAIHAVKENSNRRDFTDVIDQVCPNLSLEMGDSVSWIDYKCKNQNQVFISFETLSVRTDPNFEFKDKKVSLPFVSFDRIYQTAGGGLLLGWSIKDVFKSSSESKDKFKVLFAILGAATGYSLGYHLFRNTSVDCSSKEVEEIFKDKGELAKLKKRIIAQSLISEVLIAKNKDSIKCFYLGKISRHAVFRLLDISNFIKDTAFTHRFIKAEKNYERSYDKLWDNKLDSFYTADLNNIRTHIDYIKKIFSNLNLFSKEYTEFKIKPTAEMSKEELEALIRGA